MAFAAAGLLLLWRAVALESETGPNVVQLAASTFDALVQSGTAGPWFVKFYAPWCGHCQRLAPMWVELAGRLQGEVSVAEVDATQEQGLAERHDVEGYPTLLLFAEGSAHVYAGTRSLEALESFARGGFRSTEPLQPSEPEEANSSVVTLTSLDFDVSVHGSGGEPWFINFQLPSCGHCRSLAPAWEQLARELDGRVHVAKVDVQRERALAEHWGVERFPTMRLVVGQTVYDYEGNREVEPMSAFALGEYQAAVPRPAPPPLRPLPLDVLGEPRDRWHIPLSFLAGVGFASCASLAWVRCCGSGAASSQQKVQ